jgi:DNA-directed RNA polymerase specialized sigma24 family protein
MRKRLLRFLRSRGISDHAAEDAIQDVAERLLTRQVPHTDIDDLMRWCMTVARNSAIDQHRRVRRSVPLDYRSDDTAEACELVDLVAARMRLDAVVRALQQMSHEDLRCVMDVVEGDAAVASPALRARRHRVRRRLSNLVGGFGLIGAVARALRPRAGRATLGLGSAAVATVALVTVVVLPQPAAGPAHVRLHVAPATAGGPTAGPSASAGRPSAAAARSASTHLPAPVRVARPAGPGALHLRTPDKGGTVDVKGHDRGSSDRGVVCVTGLKYVEDICVGASVTAPKAPPRQ